MKLKFNKQQYQENATQSIVKCFEGQPFGTKKDVIKEVQYVINEGTIWEETVKEEITSFGNKTIVLSEQEVRNNIKKVQEQNKLDYTNDQGITNFSIEMETGTGKTYTYIKTMYELNKSYGWSKFVVIVPSIAIREGVLKSFNITKEHFKGIYNKEIIPFVYNSNDVSNIANINNFAESADIQVMILNYQAFNSKTKANKRIYKELDELQSRKPIDLLKSTNPILIVDEPQKMGKTEKMLKEFNPLFTIRYSATHKQKYKYNMVYRLDAIDSYNNHLVKKINVKGIELLNDKSESAYLYLEGVEISKHTPIARLEIEVKSNTGIKKVTKNFKKGDNLYKISGELEEYKGYVIKEIDASNEFYDKVSFINGKQILTGQILGSKKEEYISRIQIRETIKSHFEKEKEYYKKGIKVLSLFFIDKVAKYKVYDENRQAQDGEYAKIFNEEYNKIYDEYYEKSDDVYKKYLDSLKDKKVHSGYFSIDKKLSKGLSKDKQIFIDSEIDDKDNNISSDEDVYNLIMKDKEKLLSLEEPVRFIFSHTALSEGWDNPNIFQICTLKKSGSEIRKRQEIGRGLRICVNEHGERMDYNRLQKDFFEINNLTVIASESYQDFAKTLQEEIAENLARKSYDILDDKLLINRVLNGINGDSIIIDKPLYNKIYSHFLRNDYIDDEGKISQELKEDLADNCLKIPEFLNNYKESYIAIMKELYPASSVPIDNGAKMNVKVLELNKNFDKEAFKELWNKINIKTVYQVNFDSEKLIENASQKLDEELIITKTRVVITEGEQKDAISRDMIIDKKIMETTKTESEVYENYIQNKTKYDLIGRISKDTGLTRNTIIKILSKIDSETFNKYKYNPEEFIIKAVKIINEEKAMAVIEGITYSKTDERYSEDIFKDRNIKGKLNINAFEVKKHIYDYLITDSKKELEFAKQLEDGEVLVYAKLPNDFKIETPVGSYNPDWAIILNNKSFKYVFVVAETKGSESLSELRKVEEAKIKCANKHFETICGEDVKYTMVDSYESLINKIT